VAGSVTPTKRDATLLTTGGALAIAMRWRETAQYADHQIASLPLWSQSAKSAQAEQVAAMKRVVTVEDHLLDAGFGAWLLESVANQGGLSERIRIRGLDSCVCGTVGSQATLNAVGGLDPTSP